MSDNYEVDGVKVTVVGGGYYELSHASLAEPERVRGKEAADTRAAEIAEKAKGDTEGNMQSQGPLDPNLSPAQQAHVDQVEGDTDEQRRIAQLEAQLKEANERNKQLEKAGGPIVEALKADDDAKKPRTTSAIPRNFSGEMSADTRKALKDMNLGTSKIILEENEDIPPTGLFLGHNGRSYVIQPGIEVEVPDFLLDVLDHAVMSSPQVDSKTQKVLGYRNRLRYGYRKV